MPQDAPEREHREHERDLRERPHGSERFEEDVRGGERPESQAGGGAGQAGPRAAERRFDDDEAPPFPDYRRRTAEELVKRIRQLPEDKLSEVERYERGYKSRKTILDAVRRRRESFGEQIAS
jgi:hypothetical protein